MPFSLSLSLFFSLSPSPLPPLPPLPSFSLPPSRQQQFVRGGTHLGGVRAPQPHQELVSGAPISQFAPVNTVLNLYSYIHVHVTTHCTLPPSICACVCVCARVWEGGSAFVCVCERESLCVCLGRERGSVCVCVWGGDFA